MSSGTSHATRTAHSAPPPELRARLRAVAPFDVKLHIPPIRSGIVTRDALVERARTGESVVVISAPAGYGKSTLLSQWAAAEDRPFAYLSLTEGDNDSAVLVAYLVRALDAAEPLPTEVLASFTASGADGPTVLLPRLGRALLEREQPFVLALDDVHVLSNSDCRDALSVLATHIPEGSQLALASRQDPPLARARLRARRTLAEIRAEDLMLTAEQSATALRGSGVVLDDAAVGLLVERTEGWAAGIYLAALSVRDDGAEGAAARFSGDQRFVAEYLRDELIDVLPDDVVEFLTRTSLLEYLDGPACDAVLERMDSWAVLEELARSNLFVVPLDSVGEQYRYHHLFADLLQAELRRREPDEVPGLHARASRLFEERGQPKFAIDHARQSGDITRAANLVWQHAPAYLGTGRSVTVDRWLSLFTAEQVSSQPALTIVAAWCCVTAPETRPISDWIGLASSAPAGTALPDGTPLEGAVALLEAVASEHGLRHMAEVAHAAYEVDRSDFYRYSARYLEGSALLLLGDPDAAQAVLEEAVSGARIVPGSATGALAQLALLAAGCGSWAEADDLIQRADDIVRDQNLSEQVPQTLYYATAALVHAHRGDLDGARPLVLHARRLLSLLNYFGVWLAIETRVVLARVELMAGDVEAARVLAHEARDLLYRLSDPGILPTRIDELFAAIESGAQAVSALSAAPLTTAELRVLSFLPTHLSFQAMAEKLFVSRNTVKTQAISIYRKLGVSSRGDAVARARELNLLEA